MLQFFATIAHNLSDWGPRLLDGASRTVALTVLGFVLAFAFGLLLEAMRNAWTALRRIADAAMIVLRGVPILVVLYLLYFALPSLGIRLTAFVAGVVGLAMVHGAYLAEVFRAGLQAVPRGQREAALSIGLPAIQAFRLVIFPQAVRVVLPPLLVSLVSLLKDSSICALIAVNELTLASREIMSETFLPLHVFVLAGLFYFSLAWPASVAVRALERHLREGPRGNPGTSTRALAPDALLETSAPAP